MVAGGIRRKSKPLAPRLDGLRHLMRLGRGENKENVLRRLFQGLEQGVEGPARKHVHFVNDIDLVAACAADGTAPTPATASHRPHRCSKAPSISSTSMSLPAVICLQELHCSQGSTVGPLVAVERLGQKAGHGGLAHAARAGKEQRVRHASHRDGVLERLGQGFLPDDPVKILRTPFPATPGMTIRLSPVLSYLPQRRKERKENILTFLCERLPPSSSKAGLQRTSYSHSLFPAHHSGSCATGRGGVPLSSFLFPLSSFLFPLSSFLAFGMTTIDSQIHRNTPRPCYRCSLPGLAGFARHDCPGSGYQHWSFLGGERGFEPPKRLLGVYTISNRAP